MSFQAPRIKAKQRSAASNSNHYPLLAPETIVTHHLVPAKDVPPQRRPRNSKGTITFCPGGSRIWAEGPGQAFTEVPVVQHHQPPPVQPLSPGSYFEDPITAPQGNSSTGLSPTSTLDPFASDSPHFDNDSPYFNDSHEQPYIHTRQSIEDIELRRQHQRQKRVRQWSKWTQTVIPALLVPYLELLRVSDSLRMPQRLPPDSMDACLCTKSTKLAVICVFLESMCSQIQHLIYS